MANNAMLTTRRNEKVESGLMNWRNCRKTAVDIEDRAIRAIGFGAK